MKKLLILLFFNSLATAQGYYENGAEYLYVNSVTNQIDCTVQQLCDISLAQGDVFQKWIMTNGDVWADSAKAKTSYFDNKGIQHVVLQATTVSADNPVILVGVNYQYKFNLTASRKSKTNNYIFLNKETKGFNNSNAVIDDGLVVDLKNKNLDSNYKVSGDTDSFLNPVKIFNDGEKTYIELSDKIDTTDLPEVFTFNNQGALEQLNNPRYRKPYFVIDGVLERYAIVSGSVDNDNQLRINIYHNKKSGIWSWLTEQYGG